MFSFQHPRILFFALLLPTLMPMMYTSCGQGDNSLVSGPMDAEQGNLLLKPSQPQLLQNIRPHLVYPSLNLTQKIEIIDRALSFIEDFYVNQEQRIELTGRDVTETLLEMKRSADSFSTPDFHAALREVFLSQEDPHFVYVAPRPFRCLESQLPLNFAFAFADDGSKTVVVKEVRKETLTGGESVELRRQLAGISPGDIVRSYDGQTLERVLSQLSDEVAALWPETEQLLALQLASERSHHRDALPPNDTVTLELTSGTYTIPWITRALPRCLETLGDDESEYQAGYEFLSRKKRSLQQIDENINFSRIETESGTAGLISIKNFRRGRKSLEELAFILGHRMEADFPHADMLILDLRGNRGGDFVLSQRLPELFAPDNLEHINLRTKTTQENFTYFENYLRAPIAAFISDGLSSGRQYSLIYRFDQSGPVTEQLHSVTDLPLAVLADGLCVAACESFVATLVDNGIAQLFIENGTRTAGVGSTVVHYSWANSLFQDQVPGYGAIPFGSDFLVAQEQHVRIGKKRGELIEGVGILADHQVKRTVESIKQGQENYWKDIISFTREYP